MPKLFPRPPRILAAVLVLPLALAGCGAVGSSAAEGDRPLVATTFTILADITARIAGDRADVESITQAGADIHQYEPTTGDLRRVAGADLLISNGLGVDDWLSRFFQSDAAHAVAAEGVDPLPIVSGEYVGKPNPHAWISPREGATYIRNITAALTELDPDGADEFARRAEAYRAELDALLARAERSLASVPAEHRALVTCEGAFSYLARDLGLQEHFLWAVNTESQGTPQQVAALIDAVDERRIPAVFCESTVSDTAMRQVARATGTTFGGTLYVDSLSEPGGDVPTYLALLQHDIDLITAGLGR